MIEVGDVVAVSEGSVDVRVAPSEHCETCGICETSSANSMLLPGVIDSVGASVGDRVEVEVPEGSRLRAALIGYGVPVLVLVAGYLAGFLLGTALGSEPDTAGAVVAAASVAGTMLWVRRRGAGVMSAHRFQPQVRAIIRRGAPS